MFNNVMGRVFSGVLRRNWQIQIRYQIASKDADLIEEHLTWSYDFVNMTNATIRYPVRLFQSGGGYDTVASFTKTDADGRLSNVMQPKSKTIKRGDSFYLKNERVMRVEPRMIYSIKLNFVNMFPVAPNAHYIQNALAPIEPTTNAEIRVTVPNGYRFDLLAHDVIEPTKFGEDWQFSIPGPLLPQTILEYCFQKKSYYVRTAKKTT